MIWLSSATSPPSAVSLIVCDCHGNYRACSFIKIIGSLSFQAFTHDVSFASNGFLFFVYPVNSCHPLRISSYINSSLKPALNYSSVESDGLSSLIILYVPCHNLLWWCLSPPLACQLNRTRSYLNPCCFRCSVKVSWIFQWLAISGTQGSHWKHSVISHHFSSLETTTRNYILCPTGHVSSQLKLD